MKFQFNVREVIVLENLLNLFLTISCKRCQINLLEIIDSSGNLVLNLFVFFLYRKIH